MEGGGGRGRSAVQLEGGWSADEGEGEKGNTSVCTLIVVIMWHCG